MNWGELGWKDLLKRVPWKVAIIAAIGAGLQAAEVPEGAVKTVLAILASVLSLFGG